MSEVRFWDAWRGMTRREKRAVLKVASEASGLRLISVRFDKHGHISKVEYAPIESNS